jgi:hypothetical protein
MAPPWATTPRSGDCPLLPGALIYRTREDSPPIIVLVGVIHVRASLVPAPTPRVAARHAVRGRQPRGTGSGRRPVPRLAGADPRSPLRVARPVRQPRRALHPGHVARRSAASGVRRDADAGTVWAGGAPGRDPAGRAARAAPPPSSTLARPTPPPAARLSLRRPLGAARRCGLGPRTQYPNRASPGPARRVVRPVWRSPCTSRPAPRSVLVRLNVAYETGRMRDERRVGRRPVRCRRLQR